MFVQVVHFFRDITCAVDNCSLYQSSWDGCWRTLVSLLTFFNVLVNVKCTSLHFWAALFWGHWNWQIECFTLVMSTVTSPTLHSCVVNRDLQCDFWGSLVWAEWIHWSSLGDAQFVSHFFSWSIKHAYHNESRWNYEGMCLFYFTDVLVQQSLYFYSHESSILWE